MLLRNLWRIFTSLLKLKIYSWFLTFPDKLFSGVRPKGAVSRMNWVACLVLDKVKVDIFIRKDIYRCGKFGAL
jgi:hypothetical protein